MLYLRSNIEKEPLCEANLSTSENNIVEEGSHVWMRCAVNFRGNWVPNLEWRQHRYNGETDEAPMNLTDWANVVIVPNANVSSTLALILNATVVASFYSCKIYFREANGSQMVTARNTPDYIPMWKSPLVIVIPSTKWKETTTNNSAEKTNAWGMKQV